MRKLKLAHKVGGDGSLTNKRIQYDLSLDPLVMKPSDLCQPLFDLEFPCNSLKF